MLKDILHKLYTIEHIPAYPQVKKAAEGLVAEIDLNREEDLGRLARFISYDPSLAMELLKIANSESYGYRNKISSISSALRVLENDLIRLIITGHPEVPLLRSFTGAIEDKIGEIVLHSIEVTIIVRIVLEQYLKPEDFRAEAGQELITAATMHDIGAIFLFVYFPDRYNEIIASMRDEWAGKKAALQPGFPDHSLISAILCEYWNFPAVIRNAIAFHHYPWQGPPNIGADILFFADTISSSFYPLFYGDNIYSIEESIIMRKDLIDIAEELTISMTDIADIRNRTIAMAGEIYSDFGF